MFNLALIIVRTVKVLATVFDSNVMAEKSSTYLVME